jgi:hypothetical protein
MATISYADILKRNNVSALSQRIKNKGSFRLIKEDGDIVVCTGKVRTVIKSKSNNIDPNEDAIRMFIKNKGNADKLEIEVKNKNAKLWKTPSAFFKDKEFGGVAGKSSGTGSERQELGLINLLNETASKGNNYFVSSLGRDKKILKAEKNEGLSSVGQEPYIDVFIHTQNGKKYGVSMKGESAPSLAGGGIVGIKTTAPALLNKMYAAITKYLKDNGLKEGSLVSADSIPDLFIRIPDSYVKMILVGNAAMGGPVDYMYIGPMNVTGSITESSGEIKPNGKFYSIDEYMRKIPDFYFRIRKRDLPSDNMIAITFAKKNKEGYPLIFSTPTTGKNNFRLVITDSVPTTGKKLTIT